MQNKRQKVLEKLHVTQALFATHYEQAYKTRFLNILGELSF